MDKEIRDERTPNNLSQPTCPDCSYPYDVCDCEEMAAYEKELMVKQKQIEAEENKKITLDKQ